MDMGSPFVVLSMWKHNVMLAVFEKGFRGKKGCSELENIDMIFGFRKRPGTICG